MKTWLLPCLLLLATANANESGQPLQSDELQQIKQTYERCVRQKGRLVIRHASLDESMRYAPLACRRELLAAKKFLLDSAFKVEVIDQLVASIEEGVRIDLANDLIAYLAKQEESGK